LSLLGRLEDLSVPDIIQIVFLSRRTGMLEIVDHRGRHTVMFDHGLIVNASSPEAPDLGTYLQQAGHLTGDQLATLRRTEEAGVPIGVAALEMNIIDREVMSKTIIDRITRVVTPLLGSRDGEFNFILSDALGHLDIEYDPKSLFREGGVAPQRILGEGEKLKPLRGLEESMKAGKALLRGTPPPPAAELPLPLAPVEPPPAPIEETSDEAPFDLMEEEAAGGGLDELLGAEPSPLEQPSEPLPAADALEAESRAIFGEPLREQDTREKPLPSPPPTSAGADVKQDPRAVGRFRIEAPAGELDAAERNVVLFERSPLLRVAAKRAFTKRGMQISQYGMIDDVRRLVLDLLRKNSFFITFLELPTDEPRGAADAEQLLVAIKKKNHLLPVVVIDREADMKRRARLLSACADHYLTKPSEAHLQPALADEQLALFAEELVQFAERSFNEYDETVGSQGGERLYEMAHQERVDRSFALLQQLINEVSDPNDLGQLIDTILRLSDEYLDRAVVLTGRDRHFVALGGSGSTGDNVGLAERLRAIRISYAEPSILSDVAASAKAHKGKIRRSAANAELISGLGTLVPTEVAVLPIVNKGQVVGLLYGDNAEQKQPIGDLSGLEVFLSQAGFAFENAVIAAARRK
jgi:CheY-like chemotaxis protein